MQDLTLDHFLPKVGEAFVIDADDRSIALTLAEATALPASVRAGGAFRLAFRGPAAPILPQAVYALTQADAVFEIFIVPLQSDRAGTQYEAIFN